MDTELNETVETPTPEAVPKTSQFHCALSYLPECTPECTFQSETKIELDKHIERNHNRNTQLQCSVCMIYLIDLDTLAKHMTMAHKNENQMTKHMTETHENGFLCRNCEKNIYQKGGTQ